MRKQLILWLLILPLSVNFSCKRNEPLLFDSRPNERTADLTSKYYGELINAEYGWVGYTYSQDDETNEFPHGYTFYLNFIDSGRVSMYSDFRASSLDKPAESSYKISNIGAIALVFDTYNYLHLLSDPNPNIAGGDAGWGHYSDFEFNFVRQSENTDTLIFTGDFLQTQLVMVKAKAAEQESFENQTFTAFSDKVASKIAETPYYLLQAADSSVVFNIDINNKRIFDVDAENNSTTFIAFAYSLNSMILAKPINLGNISINEIRINDNNNFVGISPTGQEIILEATSHPYYASLDPDVFNNIGPEKPFTSMISNQTNQERWSVPYTAYITQMTQSINLVIPGSFLSGNQVQLYFDAPNVMKFRIVINDPANNGAYTADWIYTFIIDENNAITLGTGGPYAGSSAASGFSNANIFNQLIGNSIRSYFSGRSFRFEWADGMPSQNIKMISTTNPADFYYGVLGTAVN